MPAKRNRPHGGLLHTILYQLLDFARKSKTMLASLP
jgi:hypothetical protein